MLTGSGPDYRSEPKSFFIMRSFFKVFFACLLALIIFTLIGVFLLAGTVGKIARNQVPKVNKGTVLVLDLAEHFAEQKQDKMFGLGGEGNEDVPGLYEVVRLLHRARTDKDVSGLYIKANGSGNGFAAGEELRTAIRDFKASGKFVIAFGDRMSQKAYSIATAADKIYLSPHGSLEWSGYSVDYLFLKGTLDMLQIKPQIFYAGKFKSATEPFRSDRMTDANRLQTTIWLNDLYNDLLSTVSAARSIDTATLRNLATTGAIRYAEDAVAAKLVDGVKYDDEIKDEIKTKLDIDKLEKINFLSIGTYREATSSLASSSRGNIGLIYAEGDIIDGKSGEGNIGGETYRNLIRKARLDQNIKAIVLRVNSGGGSAMASEDIWRELSLARKDKKPVVVSFGDVAASGGYYISCAADSIFALPTTITGSIGVFSVYPDMEQFFRNKLGITFDGVKTGPFANTGSISRPMTEEEKQRTQHDVERIYAMFKSRVAEGRKKDTAAIEEIAQGRVWTGYRAKEIGLVDRFGGLQQAVECAARMAKLDDYTVRELPETYGFFEKLFGRKDPAASYTSVMREQLGDDYFRVYEQLQKVRRMSEAVQARMPFEMLIR